MAKLVIIESKEAEKMKNICKAALLLLSAILLSGLTAAPASADANVQALFINVRKADAALITLGDARYLVDTGHKNSYEQLARVLDAYGVSHLNGIILTHTDKDHVGGLKKLLKGGVTADRLYAGTFHTEKSTEDHPVYEASEKYGVPLTWLSAGDRIDAGGDCVFEVLGPVRHDPAKENNNSLVLRLVTPEGDMLLAGDMEEPEEADLLNAGVIRPAPVLKVGNHGEGDATSKLFAMAVRPQWAIISTNTEDEPDTPDPKTIKLLTEAGATIAVTQDAEVGILVTLRSGRVDVQRIDWQ